MKNQTFDTLMKQFYSLAEGDVNIEYEIKVIQDEFECANKIVLKPDNSQKVNLYKILHTTRFLDSGFRIFLEIFNALPTQMKEHTLGGYLAALRRGKDGKFNKLNGEVSKRIQCNIVNQRNRFMHVAGNYPTNKETTELINYIVSAMQTIIILAK